MTEIVAPKTLIEIFTGSQIAAAGLAAAQNVNVKHREELVISGRRDSNPRPLEPHSSVLPS
jgi:hypothetical protein